MLSFITRKKLMKFLQFVLIALLFFLKLSNCDETEKCSPNKYRNQEGYCLDCSFNCILC